MREHLGATHSSKHMMKIINELLCVAINKERLAPGPLSTKWKLP